MNINALNQYSFQIHSFFLQSHLYNLQQTMIRTMHLSIHCQYHYHFNSNLSVSICELWTVSRMPYASIITIETIHWKIWFYLIFQTIHVPMEQTDSLNWNHLKCIEYRASYFVFVFWIQYALTLKQTKSTDNDCSDKKSTKLFNKILKKKESFFSGKHCQNSTNSFRNHRLYALWSFPKHIETVGLCQLGNAIFECDIAFDFSCLRR